MIAALMLGLTILAGAGAILLYIYIQGLACSFTASGGCRFRPPWEMRGEDLMLLVVAPWSIVLLLLSVTLTLSRRMRRGNRG